MLTTNEDALFVFHRLQKSRRLQHLDKVRNKLQWPHWQNRTNVPQRPPERAYCSAVLKVTQVCTYDTCFTDAWYIRVFGTNDRLRKRGKDFWVSVQLHILTGEHIP